ncbi:hypothetical protein D3C78_1796200 [compost metagenome]
MLRVMRTAMIAAISKARAENASRPIRALRCCRAICSPALVIRLRDAWSIPAASWSSCWISSLNWPKTMSAIDGSVISPASMRTNTVLKPFL